MSMGVVQFLMASSLVGFILVDPGEISRLRYSTSVESKAHFKSFKVSYSSQRCWRM